MSATRQVADDRRFVDTKKHFSALPDTARRPMAVHKDLLQVQWESLRLAINPKYRVLCNAKHYKDIESNEFLFGNDTSKKAEEMLKASKIMERYSGGKKKKKRTEENAPGWSRNQHQHRSLQQYRYQNLPSKPHWEPVTRRQRQKHYTPETWKTNEWGKSSPPVSYNS